MSDQISGDLFAVEDKRLTLKPVKDFNQMLRDAFKNGPCSCSRCKGSDGIEDGYQHAHTFTVGGQVMNRQFSKSIDSDVRSLLEKAWLAYTKEKLVIPGDLDASILRTFVEPELHGRLDELLGAIDLEHAVN